MALPALTLSLQFGELKDAAVTAPPCPDTG